MCNVTFFKQKSCNHTWAVITTPCGPYMDFSTCASFCGGDSIKKTPKFYKTSTRACPRCDLGGMYDRRVVQMVERMGWGIHWGLDPEGGDWAVEMRMGETRGCVIL
ncbi:hypothetical protein TRIATDRAFT_301689 [Trichoderma atroviride IMI 206040]|uniref:Uncharacterized protein n=1 Tax=Hypocrea atroviridis (strain ATCC 20476 / IMI 206040) TaxID=452589 RepID=G9P8G8_HYPAI|nr:uncharacterized protein TRIATDRAFT_301689 [Trichoderma atroviride IMI 206040]EHK40959.1 hypothetical protein TRIATDRAFT_301689 [Trichoderma atroviride IMI 206040]